MSSLALVALADGEAEEPALLADGDGLWLEQAARIRVIVASSAEIFPE
jgi:hypothetical protein